MHEQKRNKQINKQTNKLWVTSVSYKQLDTFSNRLVYWTPGANTRLYLKRWVVTSTTSFPRKGKKKMHTMSTSFNNTSQNYTKPPKQYWLREKKIPSRRYHSFRHVLYWEGLDAFRYLCPPPSKRKAWIWARVNVDRFVPQSSKFQPWSLCWDRMLVSRGHSSSVRHEVGRKLR